MSLPLALLTTARQFVAGRPAILYSGVASGSSSELSVRFANSLDGWIYGALPVATTESGSPSVVFHPALWSTHDGGRSWRHQPQTWVSAESNILDLEATSHTVYEMALDASGGVRIESTPANSDTWRVSYQSSDGLPAGGAQVQGAILLSGQRGWMSEGNDRGVIVSAQLNAAGKWIAWTAPCAALGRSLSAISAIDSNHLVTACVMGGFAYPLPPAAPPGAKLDSTWLYFSHDGGRTFQVGTELGTYLTYLGAPLATPRHNTIVLSRYVANAQQLLASFDAGRSWRVVYSGMVTDLTFVSSSRGFAIVELPSHTTRLLTTANGGHAWVTVGIN
ncbi:MAG TPA: hypothetical protein VIJ86_07995 [Acidimicrobiales bacterium]